jgi:hypothetical protein
MREKKAQLTAQLKQSRESDTLNMLGMTDAVNGNIDWRAPLFEANGDYHQYGYSRLSSAHGGLFFYRFHQAEFGTKYGDLIRVDYLENYIAQAYSPSSPEDAYRQQCIGAAIQARFKAYEVQA